MAASQHIVFTDDKGLAHSINVQGSETVLEALLRSGIQIPYSCCVGNCHTCTMLCDDATSIPSLATKGLKATHVAQGYFLPCCCMPSQALNIRANPAVNSVRGKVIERKNFNNGIFRLRIDAELNYHPGQFCRLSNGEGISRCYSLASQAFESYLEFHIKQWENGAFSSWASQLLPGDTLDVEGVFGECFFIDDGGTRDFLLAGIGTGLAPLYGISRDILFKQPNAKVTLLVGARHKASHYLHEELAQLQSKYENLSVVFIALDDPDAPANGDIYRYVKEMLASTKTGKVFLCGASSFVHKMKKLCYLNGVSLSNIYSDSFIQFQSSTQ